MSENYEEEKGNSSAKRRLFDRINWKDNNSISQYLKTNPGNYRKRVLPIWRKGCSTNWEDILKKAVEWYSMSPEAQHLEVKKKLPTITRALRRSWEKNIPPHPGQPLLQTQSDDDGFLQGLQEIRKTIADEKEAASRPSALHPPQSRLTLLTYPFGSAVSPQLELASDVPPTEQELVQQMVSKMHSNEELKQKAREAAGYTTPSTTATMAPSESQLVQRMVTTMQSNPMLNQKAREAAGYSLSQANTARRNGRRGRPRKFADFNGFVPAVPTDPNGDLDKKVTDDYDVHEELASGAAPDSAREAAGYSLAQLALSVPPNAALTNPPASLSPISHIPARSELNPELQARARAAAGYSPAQAAIMEPKQKRQRTTASIEFQPSPDDSVIQARHDLLRSFAVYVDTCKAQPEGRPQIHSVLTILTDSATPHVLVSSSSGQAASEVDQIGKGGSSYEYDGINPCTAGSNQTMRNAVEDFIRAED